jgi:hypothetical protein
MLKNVPTANVMSKHVLTRDGKETKRAHLDWMIQKSGNRCGQNQNMLFEHTLEKHPLRADGQRGKDGWIGLRMETRRRSV